MEDRNDTLNLISNISSAASWLNRLDKLFVVLCDCAAKMPPGPDTDLLLAACDAFSREFYGDESGSDHPDAVHVPDDPIK